MLMLAWSESQEINSNLNNKLLKLTFLKGSSNNKSNQWKKMRKKMQMQFLRPWSNLILNSLVAANNSKRSELVRIMEVLLRDVGEECHTDIGRTRQGFDAIDFEQTQMHARLNCRHCCAVDPSSVQDRIMVRKMVDNPRAIEQPTIGPAIPMVGFLLALIQCRLSVNAMMRGT